MADPSFSMEQMAAAAASSLGLGGVILKVIEKILGRPKENAESRLLIAQANDLEGKQPSHDLQTLEMVLKALDALSKTNAEREAAAIEREKNAETREEILRAHIADLEQKLEELSSQLEIEKKERRKLQLEISQACLTCDRLKSRGTDIEDRLNADH